MRAKKNDRPKKTTYQKNDIPKKTTYQKKRHTKKTTSNYQIRNFERENHRR